MRNLLEMHALKKKIALVERYLEEFLHFEHATIGKNALYTFHAGGKRVRPALVLMTAMLFEKENDVIPLAAAMELVHMASLIHDDIVDSADTRRGQATLNIALGNRCALHSGDYILTKAMEIIEKDVHKQRLFGVLADLSVEMCLGEIEQLVSVYDTTQTIEQYYYRIDRKTALLMAVSCQIGAIASDAEEEMIEIFYQLGYHAGMAFQIRDDILDMEQDEKKIGKPAGSDIARGIMTLPTILALEQEFPEKEELVTLIEQRFPQGQSDVDRALHLVKKYNGIELAMNYAQQYSEKAKQYIQQLPNHPVKKILFSGVDFMNERAF